MTRLAAPATWWQCFGPQVYRAARTSVGVRSCGPVNVVVDLTHKVDLRSALAARDAIPKSSYQAARGTT